MPIGTRRQMRMATGKAGYSMLMDQLRDTVEGTIGEPS